MINITASTNLPRLAYLLSASHSGSTLLAMLLGAHSEAFSVGELKAHIDFGIEYYCSCKELISDCPFWRLVSHEMRTLGINDFNICKANTSIHSIRCSLAQLLLSPLMRDPISEFARDLALFFTPKWRSHLAETQRRNTALIKALLSISKARIIIDSSKQALRLKYLLRNNNIDIKVIRVIRDGRAVSLTYTDEWHFADASDPNLRSGGTGKHRPPQKKLFRDAVIAWKRSNEAADILIEQLPPNQWLIVRYEDLCLNLDLELFRIAAFLEISKNNYDLDFKNREHHIIGNGMRFDTVSQIKLDERWRNILKSNELETFEYIGGALNRKYGYI